MIVLGPHSNKLVSVILPGKYNLRCKRPKRPQTIKRLVGLCMGIFVLNTFEGTLSTKEVTQYFCLWPSAKEQGITQVVVLVVVGLVLVLVLVLFHLYHFLFKRDLK